MWGPLVIICVVGIGEKNNNLKMMSDMDLGHQDAKIEILFVPCEFSVENQELTVCIAFLHNFIGITGEDPGERHLSDEKVIIRY